MDCVKPQTSLSIHPSHKILPLPHLLMQSQISRESKMEWEKGAFQPPHIRFKIENSKLERRLVRKSFAAW